MEALRATSAIAVILILVLQANAQPTNIPTNADFQNMFVGGVCDFDADDMPFRFGVGGAFNDTEFFIQAGNQLIVEEGADIEFAEDCALFVDGEMTVGDDEEAVVTEITGWVNGEEVEERWDSIVIRGNGVAVNGVAVFNYTEISHGGAQGGHGGLITMTNQEDIETEPELTLFNSSMGDSETDGIYIYDANGSDDEKVQSSIEVLHGSQISGNFVDDINGHGIHYEDSVDEDLLTYLEINDSDIMHIDHCGVFHEECRALGNEAVDEGLTLIINNGSGITDNGEDGVEIFCPDIADDELLADVTTARIILDASSFLRNGDDEDDELDGRYVP